MLGSTRPLPQRTGIREKTKWISQQLLTPQTGKPVVDEKGSPNYLVN
jgi:hypothetical protein